MKVWFLMLLIAACNDGAIAAEAGKVRLTTEEVAKRLKEANPATREFAKTHMKEYLADQMSTGLLAAEAVRQNVKPTREVAGVAEDVLLAAAMKDKMAGEIRTTINAKDITDDEIMPLYTNNPSYPYYPPRVMVVGMIFKRKADAEQFAREARAVKAAKTDDYRAVFQRHIVRITKEVKVDAKGHPGAETWDFDVTRGQSRWPQALVEPAFAAKIGDVVGPIEGSSDRYPEPRSYVLRVEHIFPESNSFAQVKERLREMAMDARVLRETEVAARQKVLTTAKFNDKAMTLLAAGL